ncbi:MAG: hypothetical protein KDD49_12895, partial [Bacteroidetes bacterium]|nr:hypothetical protein [Bacteroidota bacterium]
PEATPIDWEWGAGPEEITIYLSEIGENYILGNGSGIGLGCWNINGYYSAEVKYVFNKAGKYFFYNQILDDIAPNEYDLDCRFENFLWNINVNNGAENNKSFLEIIDNQDVIKAYTGSFHTWGGYCVEVVE